MKLYLSAPYAARPRVVDAANFLTEEGHTITSSWMHQSHDIYIGTVNTAPDMTTEYCRERSEADFLDVERADALVLFSERYCVGTWRLHHSQTVSGGRHVETGYALALGRRVYVVGAADNIFHRGACTIVPNLSALATELRGGGVQPELEYVPSSNAETSTTR